MTEKGKIKLNIEISTDNNKNWEMKLSAVFHPLEKDKESEQLYQSKIKFKNADFELSDVLEKADAMLEHALGIHGDRFGA